MTLLLKELAPLLCTVQGIAECRHTHRWVWSLWCKYCTAIIFIPNTQLRTLSCTVY